jgi:hypothetical protein
MTFRAPAQVRWMILGCVLLPLAACGPKLPPSVKISGNVTVDGKPGDKLELQFINQTGGVPAEYRTKTASTDSAGKYEVKDIYPGKYNVLVGKNPEVKEGQPIQATDTGPLAKYRSNSPLFIEVTLKGTTTFPLELTEK